MKSPPRHVFIFELEMQSLVLSGFPAHTGGNNKAQSEAEMHVLLAAQQTVPGAQNWSGALYKLPAKHWLNVVLLVQTMLLSGTPRQAVEGTMVATGAAAVEVLVVEAGGGGGGGGGGGDAPPQTGSDGMTH
jgi:hypothetical protein